MEQEITKGTSLTVSYVWSIGRTCCRHGRKRSAPTTTYTFPILDAGGNQVSSYTTPLYTTRSIRHMARIISSVGRQELLQRPADAIQQPVFEVAEGHIAYTYSHRSMTIRAAEVILCSDRASPPRFSMVITPAKRATARSTIVIAL